LNRLLELGCSVEWYDHHVSEEIPEHMNFITNIDTDPLVNTSLIVSLVQKQKSAWAVAGLYGDNMNKSAEVLAKELELGAENNEALREMGELLNYNAYGETIEDLYFHPAEVLKGMEAFQNPLDYLKKTTVVSSLLSGMKEDLKQAFSAEEHYPGVYIFPDEKWARRAIGVFANRKAQAEPDKAHAVLVEKEGGRSFTVSVRSPLDSTRSAEALCKQFPTGGGRIKAAGINFLEKVNLSKFVDSFAKHY
jgi:hypothetical protein